MGFLKGKIEHRAKRGGKFWENKEPREARENFGKIEDRQKCDKMEKIVNRAKRGKKILELIEEQPKFPNFGKNRTPCHLGDNFGN